MPHEPGHPDPEEIGRELLDSFDRGIRRRRGLARGGDLVGPGLLNGDALRAAALRRRQRTQRRGTPPLA